jgi:hypothetical protein
MPESALDYEAKARDMDALAAKAVPGSDIAAGYRQVAEGYRSLAKAYRRRSRLDAQLATDIDDFAKLG